LEFVDTNPCSISSASRENTEGMLKS
jgi:hypothetical protein